MRGVIAIAGWEDLFTSEWYKAMHRALGPLGKYDGAGKWTEEMPPERGVYAVDLMSGDIWGPFDTELDAIGEVVAMAAQPVVEGDGDAARVLH